MNQREQTEGDEGEADRRWEELLQEIRVLLPGTTVLFGFLLAGAANGEIQDSSTSREALYSVAFGSAALALVFLLAQASYHRLRGHPYDKARMVQTASRQSVAGLIFLAVSLASCFGLVAQALHGWTVAIASTAAFASVLVTTWYGLPSTRRLRGSD